MHLYHQLRPDRDGGLTVSCIKAFCKALVDDDFDLSEILVEYHERLLEFCPQELYPSRRIKSLLFLARHFPKLPTDCPYEHDTYIERAKRCANDVLQNVSRREKPATWAEAQILLGSAGLLGADEGDHAAARGPITCAALALKVVAVEHEPRLWTEATKLMAEGCAWLQNWNDDPDGKNADEALDHYRSGAAVCRKLGDIAMAEKMENMTQKITQWPAFRKREDARMVGTAFVMEVACFIFAKDVSDPFARAWTDVVRGQSYADLFQYRRHHPWTDPKNMTPLAQTAIKTFMSAAKALQGERAYKVTWALAFQGLAVSLHFRGWENDTKTAAVMVRDTDRISPADPRDGPALSFLLSQSEATDS